MLNLWIIFIVPALALAADQQQRTTGNSLSNNGVSYPQQPNSVDMQSQVNVGDSPYPNPNTMAYYRNLELQPGPPGQVPSFYFKAGFNKGM